MLFFLGFLFHDTAHIRSEQKIMSVVVYQQQQSHQTKALSLKCCSCDSHEGPIISLQEGKMNITILQTILQTRNFSYRLLVT